MHTRKGSDAKEILQSIQNQLMLKDHFIHLSGAASSVRFDSHAPTEFYFHFNLHFVYMQNRKPDDNDD